MQYTVKMPAPSLVSARTDWQGCGNVTVEFSTYIRANDGPCTNFFTVTGSTLTSGIVIIIIIISVSKEDNMLSMTANLPYGPPMNTDNDYYQTLFKLLFIVSDAMLVV